MYSPLIEKLRPFNCLGILAILLVAASGCQPSNQLPPEVQQQLAKSPTEISATSNSDATSGQPKDGDSAAANKPTNSSTTPEPTDKNDSKTSNPNSSTAPEVEIRTFSIEDQPWIEFDKLPWSYAEAHYVGATRIGYATMKVERSEVLKQIHIVREDTIDRAVDGSIIPVRRIVLETFERPNGELMNFRFEATKDGRAEMLVEGRRLNDHLDYIRKAGEEGVSRQRIAWNQKSWGPTGVQEILMREPMKAGEVRETSLFVPQLMEFVPIQLEATKSELTPLADGKTAQLLNVLFSIGTKDSVSRSSLFVDDQGVIQKTISHNDDQMLLKLRIDEQIAKRLSNQSQFARFLQKQVPFEGDSAAIEGSNSIVYQVEAILDGSDNLDPYDALLGYNRQRLRSRSPTVCAIQVSRDLNIEDDRQPVDADLNSSTIVPKDKQPILDLVTEFLADMAAESSDVDRTEFLRARLQKAFNHRPISNDIASTLSAARERSGSCIEVAHVLAAILRSQQIACRIAVGLRYKPSAQAFEFHVWNQAWLNGKWIDIDATQVTKVGSSYITMNTNSGEGENAYSHYLRNLTNISKLSRVSLFSAEK